MKKHLMIMIVLLALAVTAACTPAETPHAPAPEPETEAVSPADAAPAETPEPDAIPFEPGEEIPEEAPPEPGADEAEFIPMPAPADIGYEPDETEAGGLVANISDVPNGRLPLILADCKDTQEINEDIIGRFGYLIGTEYCLLNYEAYVGADGRILSVLVVTQYDGDSCFYTPYSLDLSTGAWLTGGELLDILGMDRDTLADAELDLMGTEFEFEFGSAIDDALRAVYDEQFGRTVAPENAELDRVWLGDGGQLMFVARIYSLAGAEFYEYPMAAGYTF